MMPTKNMDVKISQAFLERWKMQETAKNILLDTSLYSPEEKIRKRYSDKGREPGDDLKYEYFKWQKSYYEEYGKIPGSDKWAWRPHRTVHCMHTPISSADHIAVKKQKGKKIGHYKNLQTCGSVCSCPICAAKITEYRCKEIVEATEKWYGEKGRQVLMITLTIPHNINQSLKYVLDVFTKARRKMREQQKLKRNPSFRPWKEIMSKISLAGTITAKECTVGQNGWHVHSHELLFLEKSLTQEEIEEVRHYVSLAWIDACKRVELEIPNENAMYQISVDLKKAKTPAEYITKFGSDEYHKNKEILNSGWGVGQELTKANVKKSNKGSSPFDLLRNIVRGGNYRENAKKYCEFTRQFKGRRLIHFSKGFRLQLGIGAEMTDQEVAELQEGENIDLGFLTRDEWEVIKRHKVRGNILIIAARDGWSSVKQAIEIMRLKDEKKKGKRQNAGGIDQRNRALGCV